MLEREMKERMNEWDKPLAKRSVLTYRSRVTLEGHFSRLDGIRQTESKFLKNGFGHNIAPGAALALLCHSLWVSWLSPGLQLAHGQGEEFETRASSCLMLRYMCQPSHVKMGPRDCKHSGLQGLG